MPTRANYDKELDEWIEVVVEGEEEIARDWQAHPEYRLIPRDIPNAEELAGRVAALWTNSLWSEAHDMGPNRMVAPERKSASPDFFRRNYATLLQNWLHARTIYPAPLARESELEKQFKETVVADSIPRLRALPQYRMAAMLGEF